MQIVRYLLIIPLILMVGVIILILKPTDAPEVQVEIEPPTSTNLTWIEPPLPLEDFTLTTSEGESFQLSQMRGKTLLIYFGYLTCPDICPTSMATMMRAYRELGEDADKFQIAFVTVDPERDTPEKMSRYVHAFHPDFLGVRTDDEAYLQTIMQQFGVVAVRREVESALGYLVDHTAAIFVVNPQGELQVRLAHDTDYLLMAQTLREVVEPIHE